MSKPHTPPRPLSVRLGQPLWAFSVLEMAKMASAAAFIRALNGRSKSEELPEDLAESRKFNSYIEGVRVPRHVDEDNSFLGSIEARLPGSRRYLTTPAWALLNDEATEKGALLAQLRSCPALASIIQAGDAEPDSWQSIDFAGVIAPALRDQNSFWSLEALILLGALASETDDFALRAKVLILFRELEDQIVLPKKFAAYRDDLMARCLHRFVEWAECAVTPLMQDLQYKLDNQSLTLSEPSQVDQVAENVDDQFLPAFEVPLAVEAPPPAQRASPWAVGSPVMRGITGGMSTVLIGLLTFGAAHENVGQAIGICGALAFTINATLTPGIARWTGGSRFAIA